MFALREGRLNRRCVRRGVGLPLRRKQTRPLTLFQIALTLIECSLVIFGMQADSNRDRFSQAWI